MTRVAKIAYDLRVDDMRGTGAVIDGFNGASHRSAPPVVEQPVPPANKQLFCIKGISPYMDDDRISVIEAAQVVGYGKQAVFKILNRLGIETFKERSANHNGQAIAYISLVDFQLLQSDVASRQSTPTDDSEPDGDSLGLDYGVFYLIQLEPEHDPGRFKVGFAININERLRTHKCSAPFARVVKTWPCKRLWERTAIDCVTANCDQLHTEVFRTDELAAVIASCDNFFAIMRILVDDGEFTSDSAK